MGERNGWEEWGHRLEGFRGKLQEEWMEAVIYGTSNL